MGQVQSIEAGGLEDRAMFQEVKPPSAIVDVVLCSSHVRVIANFHQWHFY